MRFKESYKHYPESKRIVIFIHGIIEGPKQFRRLAQIAYSYHYSIYILLLPGHGGSGEAFGSTNYLEWVRYVTKQVKKMKALYQEVILVGHSMGALLAACEAVHLPKQIKGVVLLDMPLFIRVYPRIIKSTLKIARLETATVDPYVSAEYHAISVAPTTCLGYLKWSLRYWELFHLIHYVRKCIKYLSVETLAIFAVKDEFVSLKSQSYLEQALCHLDKKHQLKIYRLEDSGHFSYHHEDLLYLEKLFEKFIMQLNEVDL